MTIVDTALMIATVAHKAVGQKRKYTGEDYIAHPRAVAKIVMDYTDCDYTVAAALLHDVVEDTGLDENDLITYLVFDHSRHEANKVAKLVMGATKVSRLEDGVRQVRRRIDHEHFASGCSQVQLIKAADSYHNCLTLGDADEGFKQRYIPEKRELAGMLTLAPKELIDKLIEVLDKTEIK